jgi:uncharacterized protein YndB with AHSA1/START domain
MARAYASIILKAPVETVWSIVRDFNALPKWTGGGVTTSKIEKGLDADVVGCVRAFHLANGVLVRERLLMLDDAKRCFTYNFETPAFPVKNYLATLRLYPVTHTDQTFAAPGDEGKYQKIVSNDVFAGNFKSLAALIAKTKPEKPAGAERWKGFQPNKVWTSRVIKAPVDDVWKIMRDFAGMGGWHEDITKMHMLKRHRSDKVSGVRDFYFGEGHLNEELLHLDDMTRSFSYRITKCEIPWMNYVSGPRLWPVTADNTSFGIWTGDWVANPQDDVVLIPRTEQNVYQRAFAELERNYFGKKKVK